VKKLKISGNGWVFGDNVDTDQIIATQYLILPLEQMKKHTLEIVSEEFAKKAKEGDIVVGGKNFGCGSSREQAPQVLKDLGIKCIVAESFARIFFRNCINIGLPVIQIIDINKKIKTGDVLEVDFKNGVLANTSDNKKYNFNSLPTFLMEIINDGGLIENINRTLQFGESNK
jgi:3-isopropylmalate dehydratase small subunit